MEKKPIPYPSQNPSSSLDIIKNERIGYNNSIVISSTEFTEVYHYSREFITYSDYKLLTVKLNIPFVGNDAKSARSRIILYLDDKEICDGSMITIVDWQLNPLHLEGIGTDAKAGNHRLKLKCCVDKGNLNIPHYNPRCIEHKKPEIFGNLIIIGQN